MFDLDREIHRWRSDLGKLGSIRREDIDELESHLQDETHHLVSSGLTLEEAFRQAVRRIGQSDELSQEFRKVPRWSFGPAGIHGGEVIAMGVRNLSRNEHFVTLLLFAGISGIAGWVATTWWLLANGTNSGHWATWFVTFRTIGLFSLWSSFFLIFAAVGLPWGGTLLRRSECKKRIMARAAIPAFLLSPVYAVIGFIAILLGPYLYAWGNVILNGPNVVQSAVSPNGEYEAYVEDAPSIDGPNQSLFIERSDGIHFLHIADLAEDVDSIDTIHWSPQSDIVVFKTHRNLFAVCLPSYKTVQIYLGQEWRRTAKHRHSTFTSGGVRLHVKDVAFPEPGIVSYNIKGASETQRLDLASFLR